MNRVPDHKISGAKGRIKMKTNSKMNTSFVFAAILACLIAAGSASAFAQEVLRNDTAQIFKNTCPSGIDCADWGETVSTNEPAALEPVVVIWSARYFVDTVDIYYVGLDVNHSGCQTGVYGSGNLDDFTTKPTGHFLTGTFQWVVEPGDGVLTKGTNTFELCGGGDDNVKDDSINISQNTLTVAKY
jgi:hypothetical protein